MPSVLEGSRPGPRAQGTGSGLPTPGQPLSCLSGWKMSSGLGRGSKEKMVTLVSTHDPFKNSILSMCFIMDGMC